MACICSLWEMLKNWWCWVFQHIAYIQKYKDGRFAIFYINNNSFSSFTAYQYLLILFLHHSHTLIIMILSVFSNNFQKFFSISTIMILIILSLFFSSNTEYCNLLPYLFKNLENLVLSLSLEMSYDTIIIFVIFYILNTGNSSSSLIIYL